MDNPQFRFSVPDCFKAHPLLRGPHRQTIAPFFFNPEASYQATPHEVELADGDRIVLHDDSPPEWSVGDRVVLLVHGLAGCHASPYMVRLADKLCGKGIRTLRMDMRGCGAGMHMARGAFHADRAPDLLAASQWAAERYIGSPLTLCGFSLGANLTLKMLGKFATEVPDAVDSAIAVEPPVDLGYCCQRLREGLGWIYDVYFARLLWKDFCNRRDHLNNADRVKISRCPSGLLQFDEHVTTPLAGFSKPYDYYDAASAKDVLERIQVPTVVVSAHDDPIVRSEIYADLRMSSSTQLFVTSGGGHLGFVAAKVSKTDKRSASKTPRRWMDDQVVRWIGDIDAHSRQLSGTVSKAQH